jgi:hypothetical protein
MAPEITGENAFDGQSVDIFACGAILFIMHTAKFCFGSSSDVYYRRL